MTDPYYTDDSVTLYHGDCLDVLRELPDASVDAIVTDPPYELAFMGRHWDASGIAFRPDVWAECLRVLKPGGHLLAFGGSRTWHRLAAAVEDAGFEIRDSIAWLYGSGFPKSLDVSKAIDKAAGAERKEYPDPKWLDRYPNGNGGNHNRGEGGIYGEAESVLGRPLTTSDPATPEAEAWQGWGTALKPAFEPIVVARKPLAGTVAGNVLAYGTGALNIDASRVAGVGEPIAAHHGTNGAAGTTYGERREYVPGSANAENVQTLGRWPANVVLDEWQAAELDKQSGVLTSGASRFFPVFANDQQEEPCSQETTEDSTSGATDVAKPQRLTTERTPEVGESTTSPTVPPDIGTPSLPTFRYEPKAPTTERPRDGQTAHPTVKPLDLMRWLVRLVTPPGGTVLEPFAGSGTTAEACVIEGFNCIAIEREADYLPLIVQRLSKPIQVALDFDSL